MKNLKIVLLVVGLLAYVVLASVLCGVLASAMSGSPFIIAIILGILTLVVTCLFAFKKDAQKRWTKVGVGLLAATLLVVSVLINYGRASYQNGYIPVGDYFMDASGNIVVVEDSNN